MKPRPFHIVRRVTVFMLAGAIVNVAVAWVCQIWSPITASATLRGNDASPFIEDMAGGLNGLVLDRAVGFGREDVLLDDPGFDDQPAYRAGSVASRKRAGWPLLCVSGSKSWQEPNRYWESESKTRFALAMPTWLLKRDPLEHVLFGNDLKVVVSPDYLPVGIRTVPFAINTVFYAAILWMLFVFPFALRRRLRIRRGLCSACAYPIGTSEVCTECGALIPSSSRRDRPMRSDE